MISARWLSFAGRFAVLGSLCLAACGTVNAQITSPVDEPRTAASATESSSTDYALVTDSDAALPAEPAPAAAGQYDNKSGKASDWKGRLALEFGGGLNIPTSDTSSYINTGFNFTAGGGLHFSRGISLLVEYTFMDDGLPSAIVAEVGSNSGNAHIWGFSVDPVIDLMPHHNTSVYVTGGGGFYRKVTNFQDPQPQEFCTYFYCGIGYTNATVGSFSSNQGGFNVGGGVSHRFGGMYGDGKMAVFAEGRYMDVLTPAINHQSPNGLGATSIGADTKLIPISFGLRF